MFVFIFLLALVSLGSGHRYSVDVDVDINVDSRIPVNNHHDYNADEPLVSPSPHPSHSVHYSSSQTDRNDPSSHYLHYSMQPVHHFYAINSKKHNLLHIQCLDKDPKTNISTTHLHLERPNEPIYNSGSDAHHLIPNNHYLPAGAVLMIQSPHKGCIPNEHDQYGFDHNWNIVRIPLFLKVHKSIQLFHNYSDNSPHNDHPNKFTLFTSPATWQDAIAHGKINYNTDNIFITPEYDHQDSSISGPEFNHKEWIHIMDPDHPDVKHLKHLPQQQEALNDAILKQSKRYAQEIQAEHLRKEEEKQSEAQFSSAEEDESTAEFDAAASDSTLDLCSVMQLQPAECKQLRDYYTQIESFTKKYQVGQSGRCTVTTKDTFDIGLCTSRNNCANPLYGQPKAADQGLCSRSTYQAQLHHVCCISLQPVPPNGDRKWWQRIQKTYSLTSGGSFTNRMVPSETGQTVDFGRRTPTPASPSSSLTAEQRIANALQQKQHNAAISASYYSPKGKLSGMYNIAVDPQVGITMLSYSFGFNYYGRYGGVPQVQDLILGKLGPLSVTCHNCYAGITLGAGMTGDWSINAEKRDVKFLIKLQLKAQIIAQFNILSAYKMAFKGGKPIPESAFSLMGRKLIAWIGPVPIWMAVEFQFVPSFFSDVGGAVGIGTGFDGEITVLSGVNLKGYDFSVIPHQVYKTFRHFPAQLIVNSRAVVFAGIGFKFGVLFEDLALISTTLTPGIMATITWNGLHPLTQYCPDTPGANLFLMVNMVANLQVGAALNIPAKLADANWLARKAKEGVNFNVMDATYQPPIFQKCARFLLYDKIQSNLAPEVTIQSGLDADTVDKPINTDNNTTMVEPIKVGGGRDVVCDVEEEFIDEDSEGMVLNFEASPSVVVSDIANSSPDLVLPTCWNDVHELSDANFKSLRFKRIRFEALESGMYSLKFQTESHHSALQYQLHRIRPSAPLNSDSPDLASLSCSSSDSSPVQTFFLGCSRSVSGGSNNIFLESSDQLLIIIASFNDLAEGQTIMNIQLTETIVF